MIEFPGDGANHLAESAKICANVSPYIPLSTHAEQGMADVENNFDNPHPRTKNPLK